MTGRPWVQRRRPSPEEFARAKAIVEIADRIRTVNNAAALGALSLVDTATLESMLKVLMHPAAGGDAPTLPETEAQTRTGRWS